MVTNCNNCNARPMMVASLYELYDNGNLMSMIETLTDVITFDKNLHEKDRQHIADLIHLLAAIARQRDNDQSQELHYLKIPA